MENRDRQIQGIARSLNAWSSPLGCTAPPPGAAPSLKNGTPGCSSRCLSSSSKARSLADGGRLEAINQRSGVELNLTALRPSGVSLAGIPGHQSHASSILDFAFARYLPCYLWAWAPPPTRCPRWQSRCPSCDSMTRDLPRRKPCPDTARLRRRQRPIVSQQQQRLPLSGDNIAAQQCWQRRTAIELKRSVAATLCAVLAPNACPMTRVWFDGGRAV